VKKATSKLALVLCQDPRFNRQTREQIYERFKLIADDVELISVPGASKCVLKSGRDSLVMQALDIAIEHHGARLVVLVHHEDCGAYGGSGAFASHLMEITQHENDLHKAAEMVIAAYPQVSLAALFASLEGDLVRLKLVLGKIPTPQIRSAVPGVPQFVPQNV